MSITAKSTPPVVNSGLVDDLDPSEARWFAIKVGHRKEKVAAKLLRSRGVECFLPLRNRPFEYKSKRGVRQLPLLGGYLFVRIVANEALFVHQTNFVYGFVKIGRERRQVTANEIELLRKLSTDDSLRWVVEDKLELFSQGAEVEICRGPLTGVRGKFVDMKNKKTFVISFGGLDARLTTCEVSPDDIVPITPTL